MKRQQTNENYAKVILDKVCCRFEKRARKVRLLYGRAKNGIEQEKDDEKRKERKNQVANIVIVAVVVIGDASV